MERQDFGDITISLDTKRFAVNKLLFYQSIMSYMNTHGTVLREI